MTGPSSPRSPYALGHRPDVQGLRALAVLAVLVNHLSPERLVGGWLGVDVFFVVSGYLITALMVKEAAEHGRISLSDFYARRARRILPAATLVTAVTLVGSFLLFPMLRTLEVVKDTIWSSFFAMNVRMAVQDSDYFAADLAVSPLRHYWSLAVEEQFYLVWPLVFALCVGLAVRMATRERPGADVGPEAIVVRLRRVAGPVLLATLVLSLAWSVYATSVSPETAYYSTFTRAHELAIGALCALLPRTLPLGRWTREVMAGGGLLVLAWALVFWPSPAFPSWTALVPTLATAAILVAGEGSGRSLAGRVLGIRPATVVGDWSFSLYLWHWPLIVFAEAQWGSEFDAPLKVAVLAASLLLSWATYHLVENPFRRGKVWRKPSRSLLIYPVSVATVLALCIPTSALVNARLGNGEAIQVAAYPGLDKDPAVALVQASVKAAQDGRPIPGELTPDVLRVRDAVTDLGGCEYHRGGSGLCVRGDADAKRTVVIYGDSLGRVLTSAVDEIGEKYGWKVYALVFAGCSAGGWQQVAGPQEGKECEEFKTWARGQIKEIAPEVLIVANRGYRVRDPETGQLAGPEQGAEVFDAALTKSFAQSLGELKKDAGKVFAYGNTPAIKFRPGDCITEPGNDLGDCLGKPKRDEKKRVAAFRAGAEQAGVDFVDASQWFCAYGRCPTVIGDMIALRDSRHPTTDYMRHLRDPLADAFGMKAAAS